MDRKNYSEKSINTKKDTSFTSREIKTFEENIVNEKDYLEKIKKY